MGRSGEVSIALSCESDTYGSDLVSSENKKISALIAEDHRSIAETYKMMLELEGHSVVVVYDGQECMEEFCRSLQHSKRSESKNTSSFDVVVLDYNLPRKDGVEIAKYILSLVPNQRIIMASSYPREIIMTSAQDLDRSIELITKPFDLADFVETLTTGKLAETIGGSLAAHKTADQLTQ